MAASTRIYHALRAAPLSFFSFLEKEKQCKLTPESAQEQYQA